MAGLVCGSLKGAPPFIAFIKLSLSQKGPHIPLMVETHKEYNGLQYKRCYCSAHYSPQSDIMLLLSS